MIFANETRSGAVDAAELFEALREAAKRGVLPRARSSLRAYQPGLERLGATSGAEGPSRE
ncbi:hypothetical protein GCM10010430_08680 [Kitasatospora cystarginea]|uniref:Uncharacterized protein n=1 Tax=Kitasatospora cystarginea TaxID=58350 RepID=A0ABN3DGR8_9ACTN